MFENFKAAGILPIVIVDKKIYYLLGKDINQKKYSDFGGSKENSETCEETAVREFDEESMGVLYDINKLRKIIHKLPYIINEQYIMYLLLINYDKVVIDTYNKLLKKLKLCFNNYPRCSDGLLEKTKFKLFTQNEILQQKNIRKDFLKTFKLFVENNQ
jgi:hypothetical protein